MIEISKNAKVQFHWNVSPYDFSEEKKQEIISKASKKYNINKNQIKIIPNFKVVDENGEIKNLNNDIIKNIQDPHFQLELFKQFIKDNEIGDVDFEFIKKIDAEVNSYINYDLYDKYRRYTIKWLKWNNFLSYGKDNFIDFTTLQGLVLLSGLPSNQSGKTTFAIDLLHFLLFGKTSKAATLDRIFNKWLKEESEVIVEGCIDIEGTEYIIKRTLTRPQYKKRSEKSKTTQKVEYYQIVGTDIETLEDYVEQQQGENSIKTNKIIKETIGSENDFDLIICATSSNLDDLIEKKDTERGRLLSRWLGLLPIEKKEEIAKDIFNTNIKPYLVSNKYNIENLTISKESFKLVNGSHTKDIEKFQREILSLDKNISSVEENIKVLYNARQNIDNNVLKIDINTLQRKINDLTIYGTATKDEIEKISSEINNIVIGNFSDDEYNNLIKIKVEINSKLAEARAHFKFITEQIHNLQKSEFCPTCGHKLEGIDNTTKINALTEELETLKINGISLNNDLKEVDAKIDSMRESREAFDKKSQLSLKLASLQVKISEMRNELLQKKQIEKEYNLNKEAIDKNNTIDLKIRNYEVELNNYRNTKEVNGTYITKLENEINNNNKQIEEIDKTIQQIREEEKVIKNWKVYLDMVGKNGISKMVLRKSLPIINAQVNTYLQDICDFNVEIRITEKNEVMFYMIKDCIVSDLNSGSGYEKTAAALAIRFTLAKNSVIPKLSYCVLDEVLGRVAEENLDKIKILLDKVIQDYNFILLVTHNDYFKSVCEQFITVTKEDNISKLVMSNKK